MPMWIASRARLGGVCVVGIGLLAALYLGPWWSRPTGASFHDELEDDLAPRERSDVANARIRGCVSRAGSPVPEMNVVATAIPTGCRWTVDQAVTDEHGCYEVAITAQHFTRPQLVSLAVDGKLAGGLKVEAEPGQIVEHADIEAGAGLAIRGVVRDRSGTPVKNVQVSGEDAWSEPTGPDGRFVVELRSVGRHRLRVFDAPGGGLPSFYAMQSPVILDVERLDGEISDVSLVIGEKAEAGRHAYEKTLPGARPIHIKPVSLRPEVPAPTFGWCTAWARGKGALYPIISDSEFVFPVTPDTVRITCDGSFRREDVLLGGDVDFEENGRFVDVAAGASVLELPLVPITRNGVDLGVELRANPFGAIVEDATTEAARAGLQHGDVLVEIDGISVAGFELRTIYELGFHIAPGHDVAWTITRNGVRMTLHATAPGCFRAPLYEW